MPSNFTEHHQLSQWERTDKVLMDDFNADNAKIDAVLAALAKRDAEIEQDALQMQLGLYFGDGASYHKIELPFLPEFMWIQDGSKTSDTHMLLIGANADLYQPGHTPYVINGLTGFETRIDTTGIRTAAGSSIPEEDRARVALNMRNTGYLWVAFGHLEQ